MKKCYIIFSIISSLSIICSCNDDCEINIESENERFTATTRSENSWANCTKCVLPSGQEVNLPWSQNAQTTIPDDIRKDVYESDGWRILASTVDVVGYNESVYSADQGCNYLLLYNRYTGVLKGFYYGEDVPKNNTGVWQLRIPQGTKLFNFAEYFAKSSEENGTATSVTLSNLSTNGIANGFENGWNCFMLELSYDENSMNEELTIQAYCLDRAEYEASGSLSLDTSGSMVSTIGTSSSIINGAASGAGSDVKNWLKNELTETDKFKAAAGAVSSIVGGGVSAIVSWGLDKIFGSMLGRTKTTVMDVQLITNGDVTLSAQSIQPMSSVVHSIAGIPLNGIGENLGIWNIEKRPEYQSEYAAELQYMLLISSGTLSYYTLKFRPVYYPVVNPLFNGDVTFSNTVVKYSGFKGHGNVFYQNIVNPGKFCTITDATGSLIYDGDDKKVNLWKNTCTGTIANVLPNKKTNKDVPALDFNAANVGFNLSVVFKIRAKITTPDDIVYSTKSYIPKHTIYSENGARPYWWTESELLNSGYARY